MEILTELSHCLSSLAGKLYEVAVVQPVEPSLSRRSERTGDQRTPYFGPSDLKTTSLNAFKH